MKKSDKKIERALIGALTEVCERAKQEVNGFQWLTHFARYTAFPESLKIVCIFDSNDALSAARLSEDDVKIQRWILDSLNQIDLRVKNIAHYVRFDTEEDCENEHDGSWSRRLG